MSELDDTIESALRDAVLTAPTVGAEGAGDAAGRIDDVRARAQRFAARRRRTRAAVGGLVCGLIVLGLASAWLSTSRRSEWAASTSFTALERDGLRIDVPDGWSVQPETGPGGNPALVFSLGSRDVGPRAFCDDRGLAGVPASGLTSTDVVVQIRERYPDAGAPAAPPVEARPDELDPSTMAFADVCHNVSARYHRTGFTDHGRQFDVMLITGDDSPEASVALGWEVLNRFEVLEAR